MQISSKSRSSVFEIFGRSRRDPKETSNSLRNDDAPDFGATAVVSAMHARAQVDRVLQSRIFRSSEVLRHLFAYLAEKSLDAPGEELKEYKIGMDALGKPASFDPRQESVVRMHAARMRQKLSEYYRVEGIDDPVIIDMPKGGFRITFEARQSIVVSPPAVSSGWRRREIVLLGSLLIAILFAGYLVTRLRRAEQTEQRPSASVAAGLLTPALRDLWGPLLSPARRLVVCVATPLFVKVPGFGVVREHSANDWDDVSASKRLTSVDEVLRGGIREPSFGYTEVGTATGAFLLGQFLAPRKPDVLITRANVMSWPEIAEDNVIFLGPATGIRQTEDIPMDAQFVLDPTGIRNLNPRRGESAFIPDRAAYRTGDSTETYTLISRIPAMSGPGAILMLSGNQTPSVMGGVQAFTNPALAEMLVSRIKTASGTMPKYFQVVLRVKAMDDVPVKIEYMLYRELPDRSQHPAVKQ
jgi:hypothetical protein